MCAVLGPFIGLHEADSTPPLAPACTPATPQCASQTALKARTQMISKAIVGLLVGGTVGVGFALLIQPRRWQTNGSSVPPTMAGGRWITATFKGRCRRCGRTIYPGDRVLHFRAESKLACRICGGR